MGTGFIRLPKNYYSNFKAGEKVKVEILNKENVEVFYPIISKYKKYLGFYIPQNICDKGKLLRKVIKVKLEKLDGFHSRLMLDGKLYIPKIIAEKYNLKKNDLVIIEGIIKNEKVEKICEVHVRKRKNKTEYFCIFLKKHKNLEGIFRIKKKLKKK